MRDSPCGLSEASPIGTRLPEGRVLQGKRPYCVLILALWTIPGFAAAGDFSANSSCLGAASADAQLDRVPDCMRVGRHIRVDSSIVQGTATLHAPNAKDVQILGAPARVHGSPMPGVVRSGLFGR